MTPGATVDPPIGAEGANSARPDVEGANLGGEHDRIGIFGCPARGGGLVRVGWRGREDRKAPGAIELDCPVCEAHHHAQPMWRRLSDYERARGFDLVIDAADYPTARHVAEDGEG